MTPPDPDHPQKPDDLVLIIEAAAAVVSSAIRADHPVVKANLFKAASHIHELQWSFTPDSDSEEAGASHDDD